MPIRIWQHTCCNSTGSSGAQRCDRCGTPGFVWEWASLTDALARVGVEERTDIVIVPDPTEEAFRQRAAAAIDLSHQALFSATPRPHVRIGVRHEDEDEPARPPTAPMTPEVKQVLGYGLWFVLGLQAVVMANGAEIEFGGGRVLAAVAPTLMALLPVVVLLALLLDALQCRPTLQRRGERAKATAALATQGGQT